MGKDPAFLFYPGDWLGGTTRFTRHQKGCYMDLLMSQFNDGDLSIDDIKHILGEDFELHWESKLKAKFDITDSGKYYNAKLKSEVEKRSKYTESRKNNIKGTNQYTSGHMTSHMKGHTTSHMENGNDNNTNKEQLDIYTCNSKSYIDTKPLFDFDSIWKLYPSKKGTKEARRHFNASVKKQKDWEDIHIALDNYLKSPEVSRGYIKNGSTWFNNWQDWVVVEDVRINQNTQVLI